MSKHQTERASRSSPNASHDSNKQDLKPRNSLKEDTTDETPSEDEENSKYETVETESPITTTIPSQIRKNAKDIQTAHKKELYKFNRNMELRRRLETTDRAALEYLDSIDEGFLSRNYFANHRIDDYSIPLESLEESSSIKLKEIQDRLNTFIFQAPKKMANLKAKIERQHRTTYSNITLEYEQAAMKLLNHYKSSFSPFYILINDLTTSEFEKKMTRISWFDFLRLLASCHEFIIDQLEQLILIQCYTQASAKFSYKYLMERIESSYKPKLARLRLFEGEIVLNHATDHFLHSSLPNMREITKDRAKSKSSRTQLTLNLLLMSSLDTREKENENTEAYSQMMEKVDEEFTKRIHTIPPGSSTSLFQFIEEVCYSPESLYARSPNMLKINKAVFEAERMPNNLNRVLQSDEDRTASGYNYHKRNSHQSNPPQNKNSQRADNSRYDKKFNKFSPNERQSVNTNNTSKTYSRQL